MKLGFTIDFHLTPKYLPSKNMPVGVKSKGTTITSFADGEEGA